MQDDKIENVLVPPKSPVETADSMGWVKVEQTLGTILPIDYKAFINRYGSGRISGFIWVFNPFASNENINLIHQVQALRQVHEVLARDFGQACPYPIFPQVGGLLPFGGTDNGDVMYWITKGQPNDWQVVVNEGRGPEYQEFALNFASFLKGVLSHRIVCQLFPAKIRETAPYFDPKS